MLEGEVSELDEFVQLPLVVLETDALVGEARSFAAFPDAVGDVDDVLQDLQQDEEFGLLGDHEEFCCFGGLAGSGEEEDGDHDVEQ